MSFSEDFAQLQPPFYKPEFIEACCRKVTQALENGFFQSFNTTNPQRFECNWQVFIFFYLLIADRARDCDVIIRSPEIDQPSRNLFNWVYTRSAIFLATVNNENPDIHASHCSSFYDCLPSSCMRDFFVCLGDFVFPSIDTRDVKGNLIIKIIIRSYLLHALVAITMAAPQSEHEKHPFVQHVKADLERMMRECAAGFVQVDRFYPQLRHAIRSQASPLFSLLLRLFVIGLGSAGIGFMLPLALPQFDIGGIFSGIAPGDRESFGYVGFGYLGLSACFTFSGLTGMLMKFVNDCRTGRPHFDRVQRHIQTRQLEGRVTVPPIASELTPLLPGADVSIVYEQLPHNSPDARCQQPLYVPEQNVQTYKVFLCCVKCRRLQPSESLRKACTDPWHLLCERCWGAGVQNQTNGCPSCQLLGRPMTVVTPSRPSTETPFLPLEQISPEHDNTYCCLLCSKLTEASNRRGEPVPFANRIACLRPGHGVCEPCYQAVMASGQRCCPVCKKYNL